ncbi:MAG: phosphoglycerate mutase [Parachlamydiales bacterium]|nr:phosphoglycerate mutase [Parachlamydiales bacterium]
MGATMAVDIMADIMVGTINPDSLQIYLCRHGETEWTLAGRHTSYSDIPLTEKGRMQAVLLGKRLRGIKFRKIIVSPMIRAQETCNLTGIDLPKVIEPNAMEWNYGQYEGLTTVQIREKKPKWNIFTDGAPNGESPDEISDRADRLLKSLMKQTGKIAIFSHAHFSRTLAARWLGLTAEGGRYFHLSVASVSILGFEHKRHVIELWNDTGQL